MRWSVALVFVACLWMPVGHARTEELTAGRVSSRAEETRVDLGITVYNDDLGLIRERRRIRLGTGRTELRFMDVPARIDPRTVRVVEKGAGSSFALLEQNYEYDLISPQKLMERFVGRTVRLVFGGDDGRADRESDAVLVSTTGGMVYEIDGRIHVDPPARVVLPEVPGGLISAPTLVWLVESSRGGEIEIEASYLTGGISWSADYVGVLDADERKAGITGWVTIDNQSGAAYDDARVQLVAGDLHRAAPEMDALVMRLETVPRAAAPGFAQEALLDYHLYTLDRRTTVKDRQTKQIALLQAPAVPVRKIYMIEGSPFWFRGGGPSAAGPVPVRVRLELRNAAAGGLGMPLPKGTVRLYKQDRAGSVQFIGEDRIGHTPRDEKLTLTLGDAFDIVAERRQVDYRAVSAGRYDAEAEYEIRIRNRKDETVTVIVREQAPGDWKLLESSHPPEKTDARTLEFSVRVAAGGESVLTYRIAIDDR